MIYSVSYKDGYDHEKTLIGGQAFNWDRIDSNYYVGFFTNFILSARFDKGKIIVTTYPKEINLTSKFIKDLFDLNTDFKKVFASLKKDTKLQDNLIPIHILKQPIYQTILSFIISSNNSIKKIRNSVRILAKQMGKKVSTPFGDYFTFPTLKSIAKASIKQLIDAKVGFRAQYLQKSANMLMRNSINLYPNLKNINDINEFREDLKTLHGVGDKIADCILAFAYHTTSITPIDVWMKRILAQKYGISFKHYIDYLKWAHKRWGIYTAYAGQILFESFRDNVK